MGGSRPHPPAPLVMTTLLALVILGKARSARTVVEAGGLSRETWRKWGIIETEGQLKS